MGETAWFFLHRDPQIPIQGTPWEMLIMARGEEGPGPEAREKIVLRYRADVFKIARHLSHDTELAKELSQDFAVEFLKPEIYAELDREKGRFSNYLFKWVENRVFARLQKERRQREVSDEGIDAAWQGKSPEETVDLLMTVTRIEEARKNAKASCGEGSRAWEAVERVHFQHDPSRPQTQAQVATEMGISLATLKNDLKVGRNALLRELMSMLGKEVSSGELVQQELDSMKEQLENRLAAYWTQAPKA